MKKPIYVVQEHSATKAGLHWDLRLQVNEVLFSWAIPKGMPIKLGIVRLAIRMPDHALSWATFEGHIKDGEYGAGKIDIWDSGSYLPTKISRQKLQFIIEGKRLQGEWVLSKGTSDDNKWFIERLS